MSAEMDSNTSIIYIHLLDEGTNVLRPTRGLMLKKGMYKVLPTSDYDPTDEYWEFVPGSVVRCLLETHEGQQLLVAKKLIRSRSK